MTGRAQAGELCVGVMVHLSDQTIDAPALAVAAEERGFHSLFVTEHTHVPAQASITWRNGQPMPEIYKRLYDPLIGLAAAASVTRSIKLGTGVLVIGQRDPLATAKQIASLDRISGGRFVLGTGYGWLAQELANHGVSWADRGAVWREHLAALRELWQTDESSFDGERVRFGPSWSFPKPVQRPVPVWLGSGGSRRALADVVNLCDGWMPVEGTVDIAVGITALRELSERVGRDPASVSVAVYGSAGDPANLHRYRELGIRQVIVGIDAATMQSAEADLDQHRNLLQQEFID
jgi:probable F420-dependent oxidoreductase